MSTFVLCCKWGSISGVKTELNGPVWGFFTFIDDFFSQY